MEVQNLSKEAWLAWKDLPTTKLFFKSIEDTAAQYKWNIESGSALETPQKLAFINGRAGAYEAVLNATYDADLSGEVE